MERNSVRFMMGVEWGNVEFNRHLQNVVNVDHVGLRSATLINHSLRSALHWEGVRCARVAVKSLRQQGLHTFLGMVGYCTKYEVDSMPDHPYEEYSKGVSVEDKTLGHDVFLQFGRPNKHRAELSPINVLDKAVMYTTQNLHWRSVPPPDFLDVVAFMI
eukprot:366571-Chlamydomonas_euryale.AAC.3